MKNTSYRRLIPGNSHLFDAPTHDKDLVRDFLFVFSRAEYALKWSNYVCRGYNNAPTVNWEKFIAEIEKPFARDADKHLADARKFLMENPPKRQVFQDSKLVWKLRSQGDQTTGMFLIHSVKHVRNNLFHGGKELGGKLVARDRDLIASAITVLAFAISLDPAVARVYEDAGPRVTLPEAS